jgi:hypothetical protein
MTDGRHGFLPVGIERGMFDSEYTVTITAGEKQVTAAVSVESVTVDIPPDERAPGRGLLRVRVLDSDPSSDSVLVELPQPSFTSEPRLRVARGYLIPSAPPGVASKPVPHP